VSAIVLASRNQGKIQELERMLESSDLDIRVMGLRDFPDLPDVDETGSTFIENSLLKARTITEITGIPALADDSGLCIDALNGDPGIFSARWAGVHGDDEANLQKVLTQLSELEDPSLAAQFRCAVVLVFPTGHQHEGLEIIHEGVLEGQIVMTPRGNQGFGYDPIFQPTGFQQTTAELPPDVKDRISHRGKAFQAMVPDLREFLSC
jgi:XTP/dITP diphosphohydrolase